MKTLRISPLIAALAATSALAQPAGISLFSEDGFRGRVVSVDRSVNNLQSFRMNDRVSSLIIERGRWQVCEDADFRGQCVVLRRGSYPDLANVGMSNRISSVRPVNRNVRFEPSTEWQNEPPPVYRFYRRENERLYDARVTSVRSVYNTPQEQCWVESTAPSYQSSSSAEPNVGGALFGAIVGGILGHQIGGGRGRDVATAGGAVAGAAIGSGAFSGSNGVTTTYAPGTQVRRCTQSYNSAPSYYDVSYEYNGRIHTVQMRQAPGATIAVNRAGEPRQ